MKAKSLNVLAVTALVMLAAGAARAQVTNFYQAVTNLNPAAYWPLQETAQPPQADVETNLGSIGAVANAYYSSTNAAKGAQGIGSGFVAVSCVGTTNAGSFLAVPNTSPAISVPVGPFSVELWIYPSNVNNNVTIVAQAGPTVSPGLNGAATGAGWSLNENFDPYTGQNTPGWSFHVYNGQNIYGGADALVATNYATNMWYHLVGVFDGTNATLYVNGVNATTTSLPMPAGTSYVPDTWDFVTIGCGRGLNSGPYSGGIEEVAVYTNALTQAQITQDFNAATGSSASYASTILADHPYMYWRMNSPANNIAQPISAYPVAVNYGLVGNLNGLYSSTATPGVSGPTYAGLTNGFNDSGLACAFNGMGDDSTNLVTIFTNGLVNGTQTINAGVLVTNLPNALNVISNSFSFIYWFKCNPMDNRRNGVFGHSDSNWRSSLLSSQITGNAGKGSDTSAAFNQNDGGWHFVTFVYTNTGLLGSGGFGWAGTNMIYVDGVLKATLALTNALSVGTATNILIGGAPDKDAYGNNGYIGSGSANGQPGSQMFLGSIAHVAFFTNALTAAQVQSLYSFAGAPPLIQTQPSPTSFTNNVGTTNVFGKVTVSGASTLVYQWYYNSTAGYSGATALTDGQTVSGSGRFGSATAQLTVTNLGSADAGYYFVVITNNYGSVTSVLSQQQIIQGPIISSQKPSGSFTAYAGQNNLVLSVTALGSGLSYQWLTNGVADTTAGTNAGYPWTVSAGQTGFTFQCIVTNANGSATSAVDTLTVLAVPAGAGNGSFQPNLLGLNPVAYWPLQETAQPPPAQIETNYGSLGANGNAYYSSTNAVSGASGVTGDGDSAINFRGSLAGGFLAIPQAKGVAVPAGAFTVEAWIYPTNITPATNVNVIVSQTGAPGSGGLNGTANSAGWALAQDYIPSTQNKAFEGWSFHVFNGQGAGGGAEVSVPEVISTFTWYHIVGVFDGTNAYLYIDGTNASPQGDQIPMTGSYVPDTWDQTTIGCGGGGGGLSQFQYYGTIDEVAVYTNALSAAQIANHYQQVGGGSYSSTIQGDHPYLYYRMDAPAWAQPDNGTYPVAINYGSAANMNGLYLAGDIAGIAGPTNAGFGASSFGCSINGIGTSSATNTTIFVPNPYSNVTIPGYNWGLVSGIMCTNQASQLCITNQPFTLAAWFKGNPTDNRFENVVGLHGDDGPRFAMSGGQLQFYIGAGNNLASGTFPSCNDGNWHFGVGVYTNAGTPASGVYSLYVDGLLVNSAANTSLMTATTNFPIMLGGDAQRAVTGTGYNMRFLSGSIAHIAYFTNALTAAQILNLYTNATAGVLPAGIPPTITGQPFPTPPGVRPVSAGTGQYVFEAVTASGLGTLGYQWYFNSSASNYNGSAIVNDNVNYFVAQTSQITISNLNTAETGFYYCIVTNAYGAATSSIVNLQVYQAPAITAQSPSGAFSLYPNQSTTLSVTAFGATNKFTYQWFTNSGAGFVADAAAGTTANYLVTAGAPAISGEMYECIVTNTFGSATSVVDTLTILPYPAALTNAAYSSNLLVLKPTDYWPMHETEAPAPGDIETNYGSLGALGNGYYADWDTNNYNPGNTVVTHGFNGALAGDSNTCVSLNGEANACLVVPHVSPLLTIQPPFTLEAWVKPYAAQPKSFGVFLGQGGGAGLNGGSTEGGFSFLWNGSPNTFSITLFNGNGSGSTEPKTVAAYNPDQWYHMVATFDGSNATIYINGQPASLQTPSSGSMNPDSWSPLLIGAGRWNTSGPQDQFAGTMDEVAIYTNLLTPDRIAQHYNAGSTSGTYGAYFTNVLADNPLLYYRMDSPVYSLPAQSTWPVVTNYGTVNLNGVYRPGGHPGGSIGPSPSGMVAASAFQGNGIGGYVDAGGATALSANPGVTNASFTYTAWFRGHPGEPLGFQGVMSANDGTWRCSINGSGKLQVHGQGSGDITSGLAYNDGNWHQVVLTCVETNIVTKGSNTNYLYVDGQLVGSNIGYGSNTPASYPGPEVYIGDEIGFTNNPLGAERCFSADICEAAFFNGTVLSSNQVAALYNASGEAPYINTQPVSATVDGNLAFTNTVIAGGVGPLYYQWYQNGAALSNGGNLSGAVSNGVNTESLIINPVQAGNAGSYYVVVTNNFGSVTSLVTSLNVLTNPVINVQYPVPYTNLYTVLSNANPNFSVSAIGAVPLTYYWLTNGVVDGAALAATNLTLTNVAVSFTNYCIVSNSFGAITSMVWSAQVIPDPTNSSGGLAAYPQSVLALNPIGYWRLDDTNEDGVDNVNGGSGFLGGGDFGWVCHDYVSGNDGLFTNCSLGWAGYNPVSDPADSSAQFGEVDDLGSDYGDSLAFGIQNINFGTPAGGNATFTIEAWAQGYPQNSDSGIVNLGYSGSEQFNLDCGSDTGSGVSEVHRFRFFFRDASGTVHSVSSSVNPSTAGLGAWYHLAGVVDEVNSNVTLYINGLSVGTTLLGTNNLGVLSSSHLMGIGSRQGSSTTNYNYQFLGNINDVAIFNYALSANQVLNQYLVSGVPPFMAQQPTATTNASGNGLMVIPAVAYGTGPLTEWWTDVSAHTNILTLTTNGTILNAGLAVSNVPGGWNNDQIELTVSNSYGGTNVFVALTIFTNAPVFSVNIAPQVNLLVNQPYTYSALALGAAPLVYQWYSNNVAIANATNTTFTPITANPGQTVYSLVVTNTYGSATAPSTLTVFASPTNGYAAYLLGLAPVGYWPLQETNPPAPVTLETNYGSLGALGNAYYAITTASETNVLFNQPGAIGGSGDNDDGVQFGGPSGTNYAFVPRVSPALTMQGPLTYEAWINSGNNTAFCDIMGEGGNGENSAAGGGTFGGIRMSYAGNNTNAGQNAPELQAYVYNAGGNNTYTTIGTTPNSLPLGSGWHHCVMTYNGTTVVLYIDGVQMGSGNASLNIDTWSPLTIGDARWQGSGSGPTRPYYGQVDEVAVYTNVLSAARVLAHYQAGTTSSGSNYVAAITSDSPLLYYRMDCPGFTNAAKSLCPAAVNFGSAPTNGTFVSGTRPGLVAGPPIVTLGTNVATSVNGVTACIDAGYNSAFNPTNQFTALGWFKSNPADARFQELMSHGNNWSLFLSTNGFIRWTNSAGSVTSTTILNDGNWHFMAGVYDGTNNYLYVDGALNNKAAAAGIASSDVSDDLYLGGSALYTAVGVNQAYFAGAIAQAAFFTNALTAAQIQQLYYLATVPAGLRVALGPANVTLYAGQSVTLVAQASGTQPFSYQWYQGASPILNATNASYTATATLSPASYYCTVTNAFNGFSSTNAGPVTVNGIIAPATSYQTTVLSNNPVAYWRLNETPDNGAGNNGTVAWDYVGGHNGVYTNVQLALPGFASASMVSPDTAALFGPSNNVSAAVNSYMGEIYNDGMTPVSFAQPVGSNGELSVEAWVKSTNNAQASGAGIVAKGFGGGGEQFDLDLYGNDFRFFVRDAAGGVHGPTSSVSPAIGQWYHVAGVFDGANGAVHLYVNGVDVADTTGIAGGLGVLAASTTNTALPQAAYVSIGARTSSQAVNNYDLQFQGAIDDVALYNYALTPAQVAADYQAGVQSGAPSFTNAPPIAFSVLNKNQLILSWPSNYTGYYYLEVQTNSLAAGLGNNWYPVGGSSAATLNVNTWTNLVNATNGCVFYRLITNGP